MLFNTEIKTISLNFYSTYYNAINSYLSLIEWLQYSLTLPYIGGQIWTSHVSALKELAQILE